MKPTYLCVLQLEHDGAENPSPNRPIEKGVYFLFYVILDVEQNKIVGVHRCMLNPEMPEMEKMLSANIRNNCNSLEEVVRHFHQYVESTLNINPSTDSLRFVTEGQLPLRQIFYPQARNQNIELPQYYAVFNDLIKEFKVCYGAPPPNTAVSMKEILSILGIEPDKNYEYRINKVIDTVNVTKRLISDGHKFENPDTINFRLVPRIYESSDEVEDSCVVKIMGMPINCSELHVTNFFIGLNLAAGGVALCLNPNGDRSGTALVRFENPEHCDMALKRHKHCFMGNYIYVHKASGEDFIKVAGGNNKEANAFLSRGAEVIIRMTNLPRSYTAKDVVTFFLFEGERCEVMLGEEGVFFVKNSNGNTTGTALVLFAGEEVAGKVIRKGRELFGSKYIQLSCITVAEVQQVLKLAANSKQM